MNKFDVIFKVGVLVLGIIGCLLLYRISTQVPRYAYHDRHVIDTFTGKLYYYDADEGLYYDNQFEHHGDKFYKELPN